MTIITPRSHFPKSHYYTQSQPALYLSVKTKFLPEILYISFQQLFHFPKSLKSHDILLSLFSFKALAFKNPSFPNTFRKTPPPTFMNNTHTFLRKSMQATPNNVNLKELLAQWNMMNVDMATEGTNELWSNKKMQFKENPSKPTSSLDGLQTSNLTHMPK